MEESEKFTPDESATACIDRATCLIASLKSMLRAIGGTWIEGWIAEAVEAAREGRVVRYDK